MTEMRMYRRRVSTWWWLRKRSYFVFVMRELSSIFVAWWVVYLLVLVSAVSRGPKSYQAFQDFAGNPVVVVVNAVALGFVVLHAVTWFSLTPKAMVVRLRGRQLPGWLIIAGQYVGLAVVSAFVLWLVTS